MHSYFYNQNLSVGLRLHLPLHTGVGLSEKELVEFEGSRLVSVEPHRVSRCLPQLVPDRAGHQGDGEAVHLLPAHSAEESGFMSGVGISKPVTVTVCFLLLCY